MIYKYVTKEFVTKEYVTTFVVIIRIRKYTVNHESISPLLVQIHNFGIFDNFRCQKQFHLKFHLLNRNNCIHYYIISQISNLPLTKLCLAKNQNELMTQKLSLPTQLLRNNINL